MEPGAKYALYHATDPSALKWAATIKLTPEVLQKLQAGSVSIRFAAEKTESSVLHVNGESFELLSFQEDRSVSHLCTLRQEQPGGGYAFHETGRIAKKLLVQRMLDGTEKDRIKDRHAKSVEDSKARSSILLDDKPTIGKGKSRAKRQVILFDPSASLKSTPASSTSTRKRRLPSALTPETLAAMMLAIDKDELRHLPPPPAPSPPSSSASIPDDAAAAAADATSGNAKKKRQKKDLSTSARSTEKKKPTKKDIKATDALGKALAEDATEDDDHQEPKTQHADEESGIDDEPMQPQEVDVIKAKSTSNSPPLIRAKRRVLSSALNSLSTFTPDVEAVFRRHVAVPRNVQPITSAEDLAARQKQHADLVAEWTLLDKAFAVENVLRHGEAITGTYGSQPVSSTKTGARRRMEGMALLQNLLARLHEQLEQLHVAITTYIEDTEKAPATGNESQAS